MRAASRGEPAGKQVLTKRNQYPTTTAGEETGSGGFGRKPRGSTCSKKATQEFVDRQSQESLLVFCERSRASGTSPGPQRRKRETVVGNRNAMSVGAEVTKYLLGSTERRFAVDHPARRVKLTDQTPEQPGAEPGREAGRETGVVRKREPAGALRETCRGRLR